jgi:uncharacterized protein YndB with AHSA1/START domain
VIEDGLVVHELDLAAPPDVVYEMFLDPHQLIRWIGLAADLEPRPGGRFRFEVMPGHFCEGEYVELDPPRRLVLTWGWTEPTMRVPPGSSRVEVELREQGEGTHLRLVHSQLPGDLRLLHDDGWTRFLDRLEAVIGGRDPQAYPDTHPSERLAELQRGADGRCGR